MTEEGLGQSLAKAVERNRTGGNPCLLPQTIQIRFMSRSRLPKLGLFFFSILLTCVLPLVDRTMRSNSRNFNELSIVIGVGPSADLGIKRKSVLSKTE